jgi:hypothetical protein
MHHSKGQKHNTTLITEITTKTAILETITKIVIIIAEEKTGTEIQIIQITPTIEIMVAVIQEMEVMEVMEIIAILEIIKIDRLNAITFQYIKI